MIRKSKKIAIVTGASEGIGRATAIELLKKNFYVIFLSRNEIKLKKTLNTLKKYKNSAEAFSCDVSNPYDIKIFISYLKSKKYFPYILVNNAGYGGPFLDITTMPQHEWDLVVNTNLNGLFLLTKEVIKLMRLKKKGRIINISSIYGILGGSKSVAYSSTKHAIIGFTKSIALENIKFGIQCNTVLPGFINTSMTKTNSHKKITNNLEIKNGNPEDVSEIVAFLSVCKTNLINGSAIVIDGGFSAGI